MSRRGFQTSVRDRRLAVSVAVALPALAGLAIGVAMPRGPATTVAALVAIATGLVVGFVAGGALRSRWAMLVAPAVFVAVFELVRLGAVGPTVDAPRASVLGIIALLLGRGFDGLLLLAPMVLGATFGAAAVRHRRAGTPTQPRADPDRTGGTHGAAGGPGWLVVRRVVTGLATVGVLVLTVALARPATTSPIAGPDGAALDGSIAEMVTVPIGGHDQVLLLRGEDAGAPVLLWLAGGPGGSDVGAMRLAGTRLESAFVVATWDQRGTGRSAAALEPTATMTFEQAVADTLEVTEYLRERFKTDRIVIAGNSWGTLPAVTAVQRHPEWFHAFVGAGQMVDAHETDTLFYADTLAYAVTHGDAALEARLRELGPPPYDRFLDYAPGVFAPGGEVLWNDYPRVPGSTGVSEMPGTLLVEEYGLLDKVRTAGAALDVMEVLYPDLADVDLRRSATRLEVPIVLVQGRHEARGRAELVEEWFGLLEAPDKQLVVFERSGHRPMFEEPDRFFEVMTEEVLTRIPDAT